MHPKAKAPLLWLRTHGIWLGLLLLCGCTTAKPTLSLRRFPPDTTMNEAAGRGGMLYVTLQLADGQKLPFVLDTGSSATALDNSLEPKLDACLGEGTVTIFAVKQDTRIYKTPTLYWGGTPLLNSNKYVITVDCQKLSANGGHPQMGILGMDILCHYCLQLDFAARKIRFLDPVLADKTSWGQPFPLTDLGDGCFVVRENLVKSHGWGSLIDTGCDSDGWLTPQFYHEWTNLLQPATGAVHSPRGRLGDEYYDEIHLTELDSAQVASGDEHLRFNGIGLRLLAQNLVTLDFPERTLYLKRTSLGPLKPDRAAQAAARSEGRAALRFLSQLQREGRLPGWSEYNQRAVGQVHFYYHYPDTVTFDNLRKIGDPAIYHYEVIRPDKSHPWRLTKAWRTDASGRTLEEYQAP